MELIKARLQFMTKTLYLNININTLGNLQGKLSDTRVSRDGERTACRLNISKELVFFYIAL